MAKYQIEVPYIVWVTATVEANDEDEALELVEDNTKPINVVGNGGTDRMLAVTGDNLSIRASDEPHILGNIDIDVTKVK